MTKNPLNGGLRSLHFARADASRAFPGIDAWRVVLALLAGTRPAPTWEGTRVFEVEAPAGDPDGCCLCVHGPCAQEVGDRLVAAFQATGIPVRGALVEDLEPIGDAVEVKSGSWA